MTTMIIIVIILITSRKLEFATRRTVADERGVGKIEGNMCYAPKKNQLSA